ncbi:hypothetical protein KCH_16450 [Kitasatospora cheerisanensis KCTC 2395]|uniref:Uncharacterized protein n=1 Tax=Kitasatospora cheerisanensis KCTC 2395 TaxID=1348663 RepID=A0A066Z2S8_9ACTN|nr:hypothetical protein KCH_16450 [Kitasatospora cheerisanensis KCTC 2395]
MVEGRAGEAGQPAGSGTGRAATVHRHLPGPALDRAGRNPARPGAEGAGRRVHRAARPCRHHRGLRSRTTPAHQVRQHGGTADGARGTGSDGRGPHRVHGNGPHAEQTRTGRRLRRPRGRRDDRRQPARLAHRRRGRRSRRPARPRHVLTRGGPRPLVEAYDPGPVGPDEVAALERSVEVFRAWDASRGGGLQRKAVVGQLNEVGGLLTHHHPAALERRLWTVAANLAVLAGWMSHDVGLEPTAQRYFVIAAQAAREADDRPGPARPSPAPPARCSTSAAPTKPSNSCSWPGPAPAPPTARCPAPAPC